MSKIVPATCQGGNVTADSITVDSPQILSKGEGQSSGILIMENGQVYYLTLNTTDLETTIEKLSSSLNKLVSILTNIGSGMTGSTTAPPPTLATDLAEITSIAGELETLKGQLK